MSKEESQSEKFKKAERELESDENEVNWERRLKKVAKPSQKPDKSN